MLIFLSLKQDYKLRLVGHSLGGASAALLAIMLRKKSKEELGFSPDIISAVGFGTPPCISKEAAESCASYVSTVVLQVMLTLFVGFRIWFLLSSFVELFVICNWVVSLLDAG